MKLLKDFFKRKIVAIDIKKYNELKQQFDAFKVETNRNFTKWFEKMPIGYAVHNKNASSHNKTVTAKQNGSLAFAWAMHQPKDSLNKYLSNIHSSFAYNLANEDILFNVYKQNIHNLQMDSNANLITNATLDGCEYKFFYDFGLFEEFAKKQYDAGFNEIDKTLTESKGMEYKINRN